MSNVRFDELELMLMAMFEQPTLKDKIFVKQNGESVTHKYNKNVLNMLFY